MPNVLDGCVEDGPLLTPALSKPKKITKAQVQRCINQLSPYWDDEQFESVVSMFMAHGLLRSIALSLFSNTASLELVLNKGNFPILRKGLNYLDRCQDFYQLKRCIGNKLHPEISAPKNLNHSY